MDSNETLEALLHRLIRDVVHDEERYSSVAGDEVRAGLAKVISLAGFTSIRGERNPESGYGSGYAVADSTIAKKAKAENP